MVFEVFLTQMLTEQETTPMSWAPWSVYHPWVNSKGFTYLLSDLIFSKMSNNEYRDSVCWTLESERTMSIRFHHFSPHSTDKCPFDEDTWLCLVLNLSPLVSLIFSSEEVSTRVARKEARIVHPVQISLDTNTLQTEKSEINPRKSLWSRTQ